MRLGILGMLTLFFLLCFACAQATEDVQVKEQFASSDKILDAGDTDDEKASNEDGDDEPFENLHEREEIDKEDVRNSSMESDTNSAILINPSRLYGRVKDLHDMLTQHRVYYDLLSRQDFHVIVNEVTQLPQYFSDLAFDEATLGPDSREAQPFTSDFVNATDKVPVKSALFKSVYKLHHQLSQAEPLIHTAASALQEILPQYHLNEDAAMDMIHELLPQPGVQMEEVGDPATLISPPTSSAPSLPITTHSSGHNIPTSTLSQPSVFVTKSPMSNPQATPAPLKTTFSSPFEVSNTAERPIEAIGNTGPSLNSSEVVHEIDQILSNQTNITKADMPQSNAATDSKHPSHATSHKSRGNSSIHDIPEIDPSVLWWRPSLSNIPVGLLPSHNNRTQSNSDATTKSPSPIIDWVVNPDQPEPFDDVLKENEHAIPEEEREKIPSSQTKTVTIIETAPHFFGTDFNVGHPSEGSFLVPADDVFSPEPSLTGFELHNVAALSGMSSKNGPQVSLIRTPALTASLPETQSESLKVKPLLSVKENLFHPSLFSAQTPFPFRLPVPQVFQSPLFLAEQDLKPQESNAWQMHEQKHTGNGTSLPESALEMIQMMRQSLTTDRPSEMSFFNSGHAGMMNFLNEWAYPSKIHQESNTLSQADTEVSSIHQSMDSSSQGIPEEDSNPEGLQPGRHPPIFAFHYQPQASRNASSSTNPDLNSSTDLPEINQYDINITVAVGEKDSESEQLGQVTPTINSHAETFSNIPEAMTTTTKLQSADIHLNIQSTDPDYVAYDNYYYYDYSDYYYYDYPIYQEQEPIRARAENSSPDNEVPLNISKIPGAVPVVTEDQDVHELEPEASSRSTLRPPPRRPALRPRPRPDVNNNIRQSIGNNLRPRPNRPIFRPVPSRTNPNNPLGFPRRPTTTTLPPPQAIDRLSLLMSQGGTTLPPITPATRRGPTRQQLQDALQLLVALQDDFNKESISGPPATQSPLPVPIINLPNSQGSGSGFQVSLSQRVSGQNQQFEASINEPVYPPAPPPLPGPPAPIPVSSGFLTGAPNPGFTGRPGAPSPNPYPGYRPGSFSPLTPGYPGYPSSQYPYPPNQYPYHPPYPPYPYPYPYPQFNSGCRGGGASTSTSTGPGSAAAAAAAGGGCGGGSTSTSTSGGQSAGAAPGSVSVGGGGGAPANPSPVAGPQQSVIGAPAPPPRNPAPQDPPPTRPPPFSISFGTGSTTTEAPAVSQEEYGRVVSALNTLMSYLNRTNTQTRDTAPAPPAPPPRPSQVVALPAPNILYYPVPGLRPTTTTSRPVARPFLHHLDVLLARPAGPRPPAPPPRPPGVSLPQNLPYGGHIGQGQHGQLEAVRPCTAC
ncbi:uncharacterized protein LOC122245887 isoform X2 [Penaeus japonicus]|uniref:uncharacterized protein LOC122245887 isoform X2 n=1 Tax=Penaeus japonicus TaxID=27405 RepID=UPI001C7131AC|nr:uncharacterized protein LOC122245887 isoform X2 [Penaeus japonicus]